ncbi:MAG: HesA/MoeB/ThiF family protein, partial [Rhodobacteraceae bacterium]|nr:HesA/MoeB/ThiF family protein [Paracoccaceae bacterium]
ISRRRLHAAEESHAGPALNDHEITRYARHLVLREIGGPRQLRLKQSRVLVVGAGGVGSPALLYLASCGVGCLGVVDDDRVELTNLQRQIIHDETGLKTHKTRSAKTAIRRLNPLINVEEHRVRLDTTNASDLIGAYDLVIDGADRIETRRLVNRVCVDCSVPLVFGAVSQWEGQVGVILPGQSACYECLFPTTPAAGDIPTCAEAGVFGALPGVVGTLAAIEAMKICMEIGTPLINAILIYDALHGNTRQIACDRRPGCQVCGHLWNTGSENGI